MVLCYETGTIADANALWYDGENKEVVGENTLIS